MTVMAKASVRQLLPSDSSGAAFDSTSAAFPITGESATVSGTRCESLPFADLDTSSGSFIGAVSRLAKRMLGVMALRPPVAVTPRARKVVSCPSASHPRPA